MATVSDASELKMTIFHSINAIYNVLINQQGTQ